MARVEPKTDTDVAPTQEGIESQRESVQTQRTKLESKRPGLERVQASIQRQIEKTEASRVWLEKRGARLQVRGGSQKNIDRYLKRLMDYNSSVKSLPGRVEQFRGDISRYNDLASSLRAEVISLNRGIRLFSARDFPSRGVEGTRAYVSARNLEIQRRNEEIKRKNQEIFRRREETLYPSVAEAAPSEAREAFEAQALRQKLAFREAEEKLSPGMSSEAEETSTVFDLSRLEEGQREAVGEVFARDSGVAIGPTPAVFDPSRLNEEQRAAVESLLAQSPDVAIGPAPPGLQAFTQADIEALGAKRWLDVSAGNVGIITANDRYAMGQYLNKMWSDLGKGVEIAGGLALSQVEASAAYLEKQEGDPWGISLQQPVVDPEGPLTEPKYGLSDAPVLPQDVRDVGIFDAPMSVAEKVVGMATLGGTFIPIPIPLSGGKMVIRGLLTYLRKPGNYIKLVREKGVWEAQLLKIPPQARFGPADAETQIQMALKAKMTAELDRSLSIGGETVESTLLRVSKHNFSADTSGPAFVPKGAKGQITPPPLGERYSAGEFTTSPSLERWGPKVSAPTKTTQPYPVTEPSAVSAPAAGFSLTPSADEISDILSIETSETREGLREMASLPSPAADIIPELEPEVAPLPSYVPLEKKLIEVAEPEVQSPFPMDQPEPESLDVTEIREILAPQLQPIEAPAVREIEVKTPTEEPTETPTEIPTETPTEVPTELPEEVPYEAEEPSEQELPSELDVPSEETYPQGELEEFPSPMDDPLLLDSPSRFRTPPFTSVGAPSDFPSRRFPLFGELGLDDPSSLVDKKRRKKKPASEFEIAFMGPGLQVIEPERDLLKVLLGQVEGNIPPVQNIYALPQPIRGRKGGPVITHATDDLSTVEILWGGERIHIEGNTL